MNCPHSTGCEPKAGECHGACMAAKQTPQSFVQATLAAEREQWAGEREEFALDDVQPDPLLDPEDRPPMAACAIAVLCFFAMAIAEVIPW